MSLLTDMHGTNVEIMLAHAEILRDTFETFNHS